MTKSLSKQMLIGLPGAGKTTFLAALWHVVSSGEVKGSLSLESLRGGDKEYITRISNLWADAKEIARTIIGNEETVTMIMKRDGDDEVTEFNFPDLSGESFRLQWSKREMTKEYQQLIGDVDGCLLLIHPEQVHGETLISEADGIIDPLEQDIVQAGGAQPESQDNLGDSMHVEWDAEKAPTQVQLVELLQFVVGKTKTSPIKLAVVVSAWDKVIEKEIMPNDWVEKHLPLLAQYLTSSINLIHSKYYGLSAQGGRLDDAAKLRKVVIPSERILIFSKDLKNSHDISEPVKWLQGNALGKNP